MFILINVPKEKVPKKLDTADPVTLWNISPQIFFKSNIIASILLKCKHIDIGALLYSNIDEDTINTNNVDPMLFWF